jgi:Leucine-rich repeat (LRR) protein
MRVRGLLALALAVGSGLGWVVRTARIQRDAVAAITAAGGAIEYDWKWSNGTHVSGGKPWAPQWVIDLVGVDYFGHVTCVERLTNGLHSLVRTECDLAVGDATIVSIGHLAGLQRLDLFGSSVTDAGLVHLKALTQLTDLRLGSPNVTDAGLAHLKGLTNLASLDLGGTQVSDVGLANLKGMTKLSQLGLSSTKVSDRGLVHVAGLSNLTELMLSGPEITDAALPRLKRLN